MNGATTYHATVDRICSALFTQRICPGSAVGAAPAVKVASAGGCSSFNLPARRGLLRADTACDDIGDEVVFAADGRARQAATRGDLADLRQRVGDGTLEELFCRSHERSAGGQVGVEGRERGEEALDPRVPRDRRGVVPGPVSPGHGQCPLEQVAEMRQEFPRSPGGLGETEFRKARGRAAQHLSDRKSTRLNSSHGYISYAVFCL